MNSFNSTLYAELGGKVVCEGVAILYSIVSCASYIVLLHLVHFYMVLLVMYSNLKNSYSPRIFELEILYFMLSV